MAAAGTTGRSWSRYTAKIHLGPARGAGFLGADAAELTHGDGGPQAFSLGRMQHGKSQDHPGQPNPHGLPVLNQLGSQELTASFRGQLPQPYRTPAGQAAAAGPVTGIPLIRGAATHDDATLFGGCI